MFLYLTFTSTNNFDTCHPGSTWLRFRAHQSNGVTFISCIRAANYLLRHSVILIGYVQIWRRNLAFSGCPPVIRQPVLRFVYYWLPIHMKFAIFDTNFVAFGARWYQDRIMCQEVKTRLARKSRDIASNLIFIGMLVVWWMSRNGVK